MQNYQITQWCQNRIKEQVQAGDCCIDATAGNGYDTRLLCELAGETGKVYAFDIQAQALENTKLRLQEAGLADRATLILDSHENMAGYVTEPVSCIVFNFGYLPGGNHALATRPDTSIRAIEEGLKLLKKGGMMHLCIYSGKDSGFEEKTAIMEYLHTLNSREYLVLVTEYYNRPNHPPMPVMIIRM